MSFFYKSLAVLILAFTISGGSLARPVFAQSYPIASPIQPLVLTDNTHTNALTKGSLFVIEDKERQQGFTSIITMIQSGALKSFIYNNSVVNLHAKGMPYWVVVPVLNKSDQDIWVLDLGQAVDGRSGFADKAIVYEATSRQTVINTTLQIAGLNQSSYMPSKFPVNLKRNTTSYLIFYLEGRKGVLTTFNMSLYPSVNMETMFEDLTPQSKTFFLAAAFILLIGFIFKRDYSFLSLSAMWGLFFGFRYLIDEVFLIDNFLGQIISQSFRLFYPLLLLLSLMLTTGAKERYPVALFIGTGILFIMCGCLGMILPSLAPNIAILLSYAPPLGISLIIGLLTLPFVSFRYGTSFSGIALIAVTLLVTNTWIMLETLEITSSFELATKLCPWLIALAAPLTALLQVMYSTSARRMTEEVYADTVELSSDSHIREAREGSELKRLLEVLNQERSLMKELQIQEIRQTEEMKKAKEAAVEANVAKSAFLAVVSHEIRTPMTGVMGMVRLMLDTGLSREQREYANTIQDSGEALLSLLNDILDFEKIESGRLDLEEVNFDLHRLLRGVHTLMNGHAASKNIQLLLEEDERLPNFVVGDPTRLRQVLLNLVNNAIKFTSQGNVTIQVKNLADIDTGAGHVNQLYFGVQDSGIGISGEAQKKIFMPFSQADSSINRKFGGTGLGLTICKRLIEAMGSSISINSREGEGSTFFFTLSMRVAATEDRTLRPTTGFNDYSGKKLSVLVVDDNGINQKVLQGLLGKTGHQAVVSSNADDAVSKVKEFIFDLVLMDIELPGKSGVDAVREIRALPDAVKSTVPVVAMTGNVSEDHIKRYLENGMNDFLGKPVMPENLQRILAKTIKGEFTTSPSYTAPAPVEPIRHTEISHAIPISNMDNFINLDSALEDGEEDSFASAVREFEELEEKKIMPSGAPATVATAGESQLDDALVASLVNSLGAAQTNELLVDFYVKTEELIADIKKSFDEKDPDAIRARAHELKGMAGNFGFKTLSHNAGKIEKDVMNAREAELRPLLETLSGLYNLSRQEMDARLSN